MHLKIPTIFRTYIGFVLTVIYSFYSAHTLYLGNCNTTNWLASYIDSTGIEIEIRTLRIHHFTGVCQTQFYNPDNIINGTLGGDCTGLFNFPLLGGIQPFVYYPGNCSIFMLITGNVFQSKGSGCVGNGYLLTEAHSKSSQISR